MMTPRQRALAGPMYGAGGPVAQSLAGSMGSPQAQEPMVTPPPLGADVARGQMLPFALTESGHYRPALPQILTEGVRNLWQNNQYATGQEWADPREVSELALNLAGTGYTKGLLSGAPPIGTFAQSSWHGGPTKWLPEPGFPQGRPRLDKMGTGEGAQAYGWGFYSADAKGVGSSYIGAGLPSPRRDVLSAIHHLREGIPMKTDGARAAAEIIKNNPSMMESALDRGISTSVGDLVEKVQGQIKRGQLYHLDLPDEDVAKYLDWDAPLSEQPGILAKFKLDDKGRVILPNGERALPEKLRGESLYRAMGEGSLEGAPGASEALRAAGIPGLKYHDRFSRMGSPQSVANTRQKLTKAQERLSAWQNSDEAVAGQQLEMLQKEIAHLEKYLGQQLAEPVTRNYVTWDQDVLDRVKILEQP